MDLQMGWRRRFLLVAGLLSVALAGLGLFVPLLPTTPFLLLAAACFARSSERLHRWLLGHRLFGGILADWEQHRTVRPRVKWLATILIVLLISHPLAFGAFELWLKVTAGLTVTAVLFFLWTRPGRPVRPLPALDESRRTLE